MTVVPLIVVTVIATLLLWPGETPRIDQGTRCPATTAR